MKHFLFITVFLVVSVSVNGQITFMKHYGGNSNQQGYSVKQCFDGGYIASGYTQFTSGAYAFYLVRMDSLGDTLWTHKYYDVQNRVAFDVIQTHDSCFVMSGYRSSSSPKVGLMKVDQQGDSIWARQFGSGDWGQSLTETEDHGFMIAGSKMFRTDSNGILIWSSTYPIYQYMHIISTNDGGFAMVSAGSGNIRLTKTDSAGATQWFKDYAGALYNPTNHMLTATSDGGYAICGLNSALTAYVIKTDSAGDTLWTRNVFGYDGAGIAESPQGTFGVATSDYSSPGDLNLTILDSMGNTLHVLHYGYSLDDWCQSIAATSDGGFIMCGTAAIFSSTVNDIFLVKTDSTGYAIDVGINEYVANNSFSVYPNPAATSAILFFESEVTNAQVDIYNSNGELVRSDENIFGSSAIIEKQDLPAGMYFITVHESGNIIATEKIIFTDN